MQFFSEGFDNRLYRSGNDIWRVAKHIQGHQRLLVEFRLLPWLAPQLPLAIPVPLDIGTDPMTGFAWLHYRFLPGNPLPLAQWSSSLITEIKQLLTTFQTLPIKKLKTFNIPERNLSTFHTAIIKAEHWRVLPLCPHEISNIRLAFETYLNSQQSRYTPCFLHGDLHPRHLLMDTTGKWTGLLDFGTIQISDPDYEWVNIFEALGKERFEALNGDSMDMTKLAVFSLGRQLCLAGQANKSGNQSLFDSSLKQVRNALAIWQRG